MSVPTKHKHHASHPGATFDIRAELDDLADDILLREPEAAAACGFAPLTLKHWRLTGSKKEPPAVKGPPAVKVYGCVRYRVGDVKAWLAQHGSGRSTSEGSARRAVEASELAHP
jgi:hypothetical protein